MKLSNELKNFKNAKRIWRFLSRKQKIKIMLNIIKYFQK